MIKYDLELRDEKSRVNIFNVVIEGKIIGKIVDFTKLDRVWRSYRFAGKDSEFVGEFDTQRDAADAIFDLDKKNVFKSNL